MTRVADFRRCRVSVFNMGWKRAGVGVLLSSGAVNIYFGPLAVDVYFYRRAK